MTSPISGGPLVASANRQSIVPLHHQLHEHRLAKISRDHLQPGDPLPSQAQLVTQFQVKRITVRQATTRLQDDGPPLACGKTVSRGDRHQV